MRVVSGFIDEGRRREVRRSKGHPRDFICMGIVREEWDTEKGRIRTFS
jgi:RimJ/RimL family protein N-acetyltransferase